MHACATSHTRKSNKSEKSEELRGASRVVSRIADLEEGEKPNEWRVETSLQRYARLCSQKCVNPRGSRRLVHGVVRSFEDQAGQVESQREGVAEEHGFGGVGQTKGRGTFEMSASLGGIAALGIRLSAHA